MCTRCSGPSRLWSFFVHTPVRLVASVGAIALVLWYVFLTICPAQIDHALWLEQGAPAWVDALGVLVGVVLSAIVTLLLIQWFRPTLFLDIPILDFKAQDNGSHDEGASDSGSPKVGPKDQFSEAEKDATAGCPILILKMPVDNCDLFFAAVNLRIEAAGVDHGLTYHLDLDRQDFIMLPSRWRTSDKGGSQRTYHAYEINKYTKCIAPECQSVYDLLSNVLVGPRAYLRVRIHATHEFTGFGRAFEARFKYHPDRKEFTRIGCECK